MIITAIGSRQTPDHILDLFEAFGRYAKNTGWFIRSGHAPGADYAFERGAESNCMTYLPWRNFNSEDKLLGVPIINPLREEVLQIVYKYESYAEKLSDAIKKIKSRNVYQVLGQSLNNLSNIVVCWTNNGEIIGGTGLALKIANENKIPIINLGNEYMSIDRLIEEIEFYL